MKTITSIAVALLFTAASSSFAQEAAACADSATSTVVYQTPVIYHAPVVYQAAVAYYAPVYYMSACATPPACPPAPRCEERPAVSTVTVIGAHGGSYTYSNDRCVSSSVIYFGSGSRTYAPRRLRY